MRSVYLILHILELLLTVACAIMHILGFRYLKEPFSHEFFFCGLFFMFTIFNLVGIVVIFVNLPVSVIYESVISGVAAVGFIVATFLSMGHAERDFHLTYLSDREEFYHPYFMKLRLQSIFSLTAGYLYLLHSFLTFDVFLAKRKEEKELTLGKTIPVEVDFDEPDKDHNPTMLFMVDKPVFFWVAKKCPRCCKFVLEDMNEPVEPKTEA